MNTPKNNIEIYQANSSSSVEVKLEGDTVWLTQMQMSELFDKNIRTVNEHVLNIFKDKELDKDPTIRNFRIVRQEGKRKVSRNIEHYNLDMIISVGYRVNSKQGVQFRQWATKVLKDYLVQGFAVNQTRLQEQSQQLQALKKVISLQEKVLSEYQLKSDETEGLITVIAKYSKALDILDDYDHQRLLMPETGSEAVFQIHYPEARKAIDELGKQTQFEGLFGREKDESFRSSLSAIYQTFGGDDLYKTTEEKAAHLLYFVVKNHSFTDGNKRIAAFLFVWFLDKNQLLYRHNGDKSISNNTLVALTLMIAESHPDDKEMMVKVIVTLMIS